MHIKKFISTLLDWKLEPFKLLFIFQNLNMPNVEWNLVFSSQSIGLRSSIIAKPSNFHQLDTCSMTAWFIFIRIWTNLVGDGRNQVASA